jgi:hypothetical protein
MKAILLSFVLLTGCSIFGEQYDTLEDCVKATAQKYQAELKSCTEG